MKIQPASIKSTVNSTIINRITDPIKKATNSEKRLLSEALGLTTDTSKSIQPRFRIHGEDIIDGEVLPNIDVTSKGISLADAIGNVVNVELARIRGQLKNIPMDSFNL